MNAEKFITAYNETRNGCNFFVRHPFARKFQYSDGVQECADAGCHWLLDIAATELPKAMRTTHAERALLEVRVSGAEAVMQLTTDDDLPPIWRKRIGHTDMPEGKWIFELADEGERVAMILLTEH